MGQRVNRRKNRYKSECDRKFIREKKRSNKIKQKKEGNGIEYTCLPTKKKGKERKKIKKKRKSELRQNRKEKKKENNKKNGEGEEGPEQKEKG